MNVFGGETVNVSTVIRLLCRFQSGDRDVSDKPLSGLLRSATNKENKARLDELIESNRRITVNEMSTELRVNVSAIENLISIINYLIAIQQKVCQMAAKNSQSAPKRPPGDCQSGVVGAI